MSCEKFQLPNKRSIDDACVQFDSDSETRIVESALSDLFGKYPDNTNEAQILLKVVALNDLYSTQLPMRAPDRPNVFDIAKAILKLNVDREFNNCSLTIVNSISTTEIEGKRQVRRFSFATKYANWHKPDAYQIWDRNVQNYLTCLKRYHPTDWDSFSQGFKLSAAWGYREFHELMLRFRDNYGLQAVSFKNLDKFLWIHGVPEASSQDVTEAD